MFVLMRIFRQLQVLVGLALLGAAGLVMAEVPEVESSEALETVIVSGAAALEEVCNDATPAHARSLADKAFQSGAFQRAGVCYLAAGEPSLADRAFVKAAAQNKVDTSRRLASNLDEAKAQARQLKAAFHHR